MTSTSGNLLFGAIMFIALLSQVLGHSFVTSPTSRSNQLQSQSGCRGPNCLGPCDTAVSSSNTPATSASRGDPITVTWPRNNHAGGFIRFAWARTSESNSHAAFDSHVQQINCHEVGGCSPDDASNPNGGDSAGGGLGPRSCSTQLTVPLDLTDGAWTLQWAWFGGAFALGDYYSCVDYNIAGGNVGTLTPVFKGGDYTYPGQQKCKFFNTNALHVCTVEPCALPASSPFVLMATQSGVPAAGQLGSAVVVPSTPATPVPTPVPAATTGRVVPATTAAATTGRVVPATTGRVVPATTAAVPAPTPAPTPVPTPVPTPTPATPAVPIGTTGCQLGKQNCVSAGSYQTCTNGVSANYWAAPQQCNVGLSCRADIDGIHIRCL